MVTNSLTYRPTFLWYNLSAAYKTGIKLQTLIHYCIVVDVCVNQYNNGRYNDDYVSNEVHEVILT
jgi:hypothetical protein